MSERFVVSGPGRELHECRNDQVGGVLLGNSKKDAKQRRRTRRLAERAEQFERHAALVIARAGGLCYPQKRLHADGFYSISLPPEVMELFGEQEELFRAKFGRKMGPDDPIFFDPDAEEPTPLSAERYSNVLKTFADQSDDPQLRALALASLEVGYMVTEMNQHLFTAHRAPAFSGCR